MSTHTSHISEIEGGKGLLNSPSALFNSEPRFPSRHATTNNVHVDNA